MRESRSVLRLGALVGGTLSLALASWLVAERPGAQRVTVSIGEDAVKALQEEGFPMRVSSRLIAPREGVVLYDVFEDDIERLSHFMHHAFGRCGGFFVETLETLHTLAADEIATFIPPSTEIDVAAIPDAVAQVDASAIQQTIESLSQFPNRYYKSQTGVESQKWLASQWKEIAKGRSDIEVKEFVHAQWMQPSIILTWKGSERPDEWIILGGHGDSISQWGGSEEHPADTDAGLEMKAPGADDNASGVSTLTEVLRVLVASDFRPKRSVQFISYAAEEVGLRGSQDIANQYKAARKVIRGVIQLDMTNFTERPDEMVLITDNTNAAHNDYVQGLLQRYLPDIQVKRDECGYACSDHASWNRHGYPVSFPFEARADEYNSAIHTAQDTIARSQNHANHAAKFARLVVAYAMEMAQ